MLQLTLGRSLSELVMLQQAVQFGDTHNLQPSELLCVQGKGESQAANLALGWNNRAQKGKKAACVYLIRNLNVLTNGTNSLESCGTSSSMR